LEEINGMKSSRIIVITTMLAFLGLISAVVRAEPSTAGETAANAPEGTGPLTLFVLDCYDRAFNGEPGVYDDCYTEDFKAIGPETKMLSPFEDGSLRGREYIQAYHDMNHGDAVAWNSALFEMVWSIETEDMVIRLMRGIYSESNGSYLGINDIPDDRKVTINGVFVDWLRDGKIHEQFFAYDTLNFLLDTAGGDFNKAGEGLRAFGAMIEAMQELPPQ
jgi:hypothetical protein